MAISITQQPTPSLLGTADKIVYVVVEDTNVAEPKFRYICEIIRNSSTIAMLKQLPNGSQAGVFDVSRILQAYVSQDYEKHALGTTGTAPNSMDAFTLKFYYEYASNADSDPNQYPAAAVTTTDYVVNGTFTPVFNDYDVTNVNNYFLDSSDSKFLSVYNPQKLVAQENDQGIIAFINGTTNAPWNSNPAYIHVKYYASDGSALQADYFVTSPTPSAANSASQFLLYFGIYPANLEVQNVKPLLKPSQNTGWAYYTVQAASSTTLSGNETSTQYKISGKGKCKYTPIRLAWWNELGGWDYYTFYSKNVHSQRVQRSDFREAMGNSYNANGGTIDFEVKPYEGGLKVSNVKTTNTWQLNTDAEDEDFNSVVDSIMSSPNVLWYYQNAWRGCVVTDTGIDFLTSVNDKGIVYTVNIEESRYKPTI
mgnify:CR=1 FL=1